MAKNQQRILGREREREREREQGSKNRKLVIWDLFGGGQNSVRQALKSANLTDKYEVYTFDVIQESNSFKNIVCDLSMENICEHFVKLIKDKIIKKCDYIVASPNCQSFSVAMQSISTHKSKNGNFFSGNPHRYFDHEKGLVCPWPVSKNIKWNGFSGNSYPNGSKSVPKFVSELGNRCIENTIKLIQYFRPKCWYIENPSGSLMWKYIKHNLNFKVGYQNIAHYSSYSDDYSRKPTCFLSNIEMNLNKTSSISCKKIDNNNYYLILSGACRDNEKDEMKRQRAEEKLSKQIGHQIKCVLKYKKNSMERSSIPDSLILHILNFFDGFNGKDFDDKLYNNSFPLTPWTKPITIKQMKKEVSI